MKWDTAKKSKRWLKALKNNGFRSPYQVLVDDSFLRIANKHGIKFLTVKDVLKGEPKLFMTECTYKLYKPQRSLNDFSGECEIIKCGHEKHDVNCSYDFIKENNPHHYILATNNIHFINRLKCSRHIPVLRIFRNALMIECFQMDPNPRIHMDEPASRRELSSLKKMLG